MKIIQDQKHLIVSGFPDFLSVASIKRNGHIFTLHLKLMMSDPLDFQHDTNPKGCVL